MGIMDNLPKDDGKDVFRIALRRLEDGRLTLGESNPADLVKHTANSLRNMLQMLEEEPEYAKTLSINAQGIAYLHGAAGVLAKFTTG